MEKTLALAGVFQAGSMVTQIASKGVTDQHDLETAVRSILNQDPASTLDVYGNTENLRTGLHVMTQHLSNGTFQRDMNTARYVIGILHLARKLTKRHAMLETIAHGLQRAREQVELFGIAHENVLANLAGIYTDTISTIAPKIIVAGDSRFLSNPQNADKIRTILLAGIRSAILWQQLGGSRLQIIFKRKMFVDEARRILQHEMSAHLH